MKANLFAPDMTQWVQHYLPQRGSFATYVIAVALTAIALFARLVMAPVDAGLQPFLTKSRPLKFSLQ